MTALRDNRIVRHSAALAGAALMACGPSSALTDEEIFRAFPFNLQNPGARALGIGGAFISLADDSTAAQANPAGLMQLRRPELFAELRSSGRDAVATNLDVPIDTNTFTGTISAGALSDPANQVHASFVSYVLPRDNVAFGFSRLESLRVRSRTKNSFEVVGQRAIFNIGMDGRPVIVGTEPVDEARTSEADVSATISQYNVGVATDLHPRFSVGITAVVGVLAMDGRVDNLFTDRSDPGLSGFTLLDYATRIDDTDVDLAVNVGFLWRPTDAFRLGFVFREGNRFVVREEVADAGVSAAKVQEQFGAAFANVIHTPDTVGAGMSYRPSEPLTFFVDFVRIQYSDLLDGYRSGLNRITYPDDETVFTAEDGNELHVGAEYVFLRGTTPIAVRAGVWREADSRIYATEPGLDVVFPAGENITHVTAGAGVTLRQSIQLDVALDVSSESTSLVASAIHRF